MPKTRQILHVDMDAFYASVEQLDNPEFKGRPVIVGGLPENRGVVAAASYEVRKYGVRSAMPTSQALRLCPDAKILPVRISRYSEISKQIHKIFYDYTPQIEPISLDEAFLDVTGSIKLFGSAEKIGKEIKARIKEDLGLTASVGIAPNKFLAKLASDLEKPDGFVVITQRSKQQILERLPVSKIWGVGKVTAGALQSNGINTIGQLSKSPRHILKTIFGNQTEAVLKLAQGIDDRPVESVRQAKSISAEETFSTDIIDKDILLNILSHQVEEVAQRLRSEGLEGKTITLKLRYKDFKTITRSATLDTHTNITIVLLKKARAVFENWYENSAARLRLFGFGVSNLCKAGSGRQLLLFTNEKDKKQSNIDEVYDKIRGKYGNGSLTRGQG